MALKFLNKKGWHTGSLRNIENVWKAEQKHDAEQKKLEELRKQIQEERERSEYRLLQQQAGLVPIQERLDFLYDSGLSVGKGSSDAFKGPDVPPLPPATNVESSSSKQPNAVGALFEDKPQSANDAWRKLHSDPLLMIRQREHEALSKIKNNPIQMAMIHKSVDPKKRQKDEKRWEKEQTKHSKSKRAKQSSYQSDSEISASSSDEGTRKHRKISKHKKHSFRDHLDSGESVNGAEEERRRHRSLVHGRYSDSCVTTDEGEMRRKRSNQTGKHHVREHPKNEKYLNRSHLGHEWTSGDGEKASRRSHQSGERYSASSLHDLKGNPSAKAENYKRPPVAPRLSAEEKAARAREMQQDADLHEEQRWKRLKKASEADAKEAALDRTSRSRNFMDAAQKSAYGIDDGGSSTIEESVRRRTFYSQGRSEAHEGNAFRR